MSIVVHVDASPELRALLEGIERQLAHLTQGLRHMANELDAVIASLNANTNAVATRIDNLIAALAASGQAATPEQLAELNTISDHLKALGADPANPVPDARPPVSQRAPVQAIVTPQAPAPSSDTPTGEMPPLKPDAT